jgi:tetratricopeptide (TPR) repeat protein
MSQPCQASGRGAMRRLLALLALSLALCGACSRGNGPAASTFNQAREAYLGGDFARSRQLYEAYLKSAPAAQDNPANRANREEAFWRLALISGLTSGGPARTVEVLEAAIGDFADDREKLAVFMPELARVLEGERQFAKAADILTRYAQLDGLPPAERATGLLRLAKDYRRLKKLPQAKEALARCLEVTPQTGRENACRAELALIAAMENNWAEAAKVLEKLVAGDQRQDAEDLFDLAEAYENLDRKNDALHIYKELLPSYPNKVALAARLEPPGK